MKHYVFSRLLQLIPILFVITFLSFAMMRLAGSDVVLQSMERTGMAASDAVVAAARAELGLDKPFLTQYFTWLGKLLHGDMGRSYVSGRPVFETFIAKLPATLLLTGVSVGLTLLVSLPLGIFSAVNQNRWRLGDPQSEFCGQQHPQLLCGTPFALHLRYSTAVAAGDFTSAHC